MPVLPFVDPHEQRTLRETVASICRGFGHGYTCEKVAAGLPRSC